MTRVACNGAQSVITASALGGTGPYSYVWSSPTNASYSVVPQVAPMNVFGERYDNNFGETSTTPLYSVICAGGITAPISYHPDFLPAHEGYCSLVLPSNNSAALIQAGCPNCIDTSQVLNEIGGN